jgi:hypothetical protein
MRWINHSQQWPAGTQLNLIFVEQICRLRNALTVDECAVETLEIDNDKLIVRTTDFGMPARNHCRRGIDDHVAFRIAAEPKHIFVQFKAPRASGLGID